MPPPMPSQKGTGKKGRDRQSRSRNTTPSLIGSGSALPQVESGLTAYLELPINQFHTDEDILDNYGSPLPSSKELEGLLERLTKLVQTVEQRGTVCDRGMRTVVGLRKDRLEEIETERRDEERKERLRKDAADEEERGRNKKASKMKKRKDASTGREERPLTHGAHGLAAQDGSHPGEKSSTAIVAWKLSIVIRVVLILSPGVVALSTTEPPTSATLLLPHTPFKNHILTRRSRKFLSIARQEARSQDVKGARQ